MRGLSPEAGERNGERPPGVPDTENATGVVVIGTEICGLSSCSSGTSPTAPGGSNDALVERATRRHDRPSRENSGSDREGV